MNLLMLALLGAPVYDEPYNKCKKQIKKLKDHLHAVKSRLSDNYLSVYTKERKSKKDESIPILEKKSFKLISKMSNFEKFHHVAWNPSDPNEIATISNHGKLIIWDIRKAKQKLIVSTGSCRQYYTACSYSLDGKYIAGSQCSEIRIYDRYNIVDNEYDWIKKPTFEIYGGPFKFHFHFIDNEHILSATGERDCKLYDVTKSQEIATFGGHMEDIANIDIFRDKSIFITASYDCTSLLYDYRCKWKPIARIKEHEFYLNDVQFFPDGNAFASASDDDCIKLIDLKTYRVMNIYSLTDNNIYNYDHGSVNCKSIDFSKSGYYLFGGYDGYKFNCVAFNTLTAQVEHKIDIMEPVESIKVSPNGYGLAVCGGWYGSIHGVLSIYV